MNGYELSRNWFDWCFENPEKIKPNHTALYFFAVEHCNRLGWKDKFGMPTTMAMEAIGIKSYNTYINTLNDLVEWGFIQMVQRSKNQYSANIVALSNFDKAVDKALDKALIKHGSKQLESIDSINKQETSEPIKQVNVPTREEVEKKICTILFSRGIASVSFPVEDLAQRFHDNYESKGWQINGQKIVKWQPRLNQWVLEELKKDTSTLETQEEKEAREFMQAIKKQATNEYLYGNETRKLI
jgi:hypothetical protein